VQICIKKYKAQAIEAIQIRGKLSPVQFMVGTHFLLAIACVNMVAREVYIGDWYYPLIPMASMHHHKHRKKKGLERGGSRRSLPLRDIIL